MKITLTDRENGKVITLITSDTYMFDLPCIGSDGMMYNIHKIWENEQHRHTDRIVIIDEKQGYFISTHINSKNEHLKYDFYVKEIFDFANNIDSYIMLYEFDFNYLDEFDGPSKHNRISRLLTDSAIEKHNLDRYMYIGCYNN